MELPAFRILGPGDEKDSRTNYTKRVNVDSCDDETDAMGRMAHVVWDDKGLVCESLVH